MFLKDCKEQIDKGETAKHRRWRSVLHYQVRKDGEYYARHAEGYKNQNGREIVQPNTIHYRTWEDLIDGFDGYYSDNEWILTDEPFTQYLPPEQAMM